MRKRTVTGAVQPSSPDRPWSARARGSCGRLLLAAGLALACVGMTSIVAGPAHASQADDLAAADRAEAAGDLDAALLLVRRAAADPSSGAGAEALVRLCELSPDGEEVAWAAAQLIEHHRNHAGAGRASEILGHYRAARGEYVTAARFFHTAAARASASDRDRLLLLRARALLGAGKYVEAREVFDEVAHAHETGHFAAAAALGIGDAALLEGNHARAATAYREYLERFPADDAVPIALGQLARALDAQEDADAAVIVLRRLVADYPESIEATAARDRLRQLGRSSAEPAAAETITTETRRGHYALQVGAFGSEENAQDLARQLMDQGLEDVRIEREDRDDGRVFYRVRLGSYRDPEEAEAAGNSLRESHGLVSQVVSR